jgi:hypothetical protein
MHAAGNPFKGPNALTPQRLPFAILPDSRLEKQKEKWNSQCSFPQFAAGADGSLVINFHSMSFDRESASQRDIPDSGEQARVLLEICRNDIDEAHVIAAINVKFAIRREWVLYWSRVQEALVSVEHQLVVAVPPPDWQGTESRAISVGSVEMNPGNCIRREQRCRGCDARPLKREAYGPTFSWKEALPPAQMGAETDNDSAPITREGPTAIRIEGCCSSGFFRRQFRSSERAARVFFQINDLESSPSGK